MLNPNQKLISGKLLHTLMMPQHTKQNHWKDWKTFRNVSLLTELRSLQKTINVWFRIVNGSRRKTNSKWLREFNWLSILWAVIGGFCKICTFFGDEVKHENNTSVSFFSEPLPVKKCSYRCLKHHDTSTGLHKKAMEDYTVMMMQISSKSMTTKKNI